MKLCLGGLTFSQLVLCILSKGRERDIAKNKMHLSYSVHFYLFCFPTHSPWLLKQGGFFPVSI